MTHKIEKSPEDRAADAAFYEPTLECKCPEGPGNYELCAKGVTIGIVTVSHLPRGQISVSVRSLNPHIEGKMLQTMAYQGWYEERQGIWSVAVLEYIKPFGQAIDSNDINVKRS